MKIAIKLVRPFGFLLTLVLGACFPEGEKQTSPDIPSDTVAHAKEVDSVETIPIHEDSAAVVEADTLSKLEAALQNHGLVNILTLDTTLQVDLKYTTTDNFLGIDLYGALNNCYLQPDVAEKLVAANAHLKELHPDLHLLVYDGVRPRSVQQLMWVALDSLPLKERTKYVSNPKNGSLHNYGAAIDLTIADSTGQPLDMGTPYDYFGELAYPRKEWELHKRGLLTRKQIDNRSLLRAVMYKAGFFNIQTEWWHFNSCTRAEAAKKYEIVE